MSDSVIVMPESQVRARTSPRVLSDLYLRFSDFQRDEELVRSVYPWADRFVMGLPLAPWQRELVWSDEQKKDFVRSVWMEVDIGSYLINNLDDFFYEEDCQLRAPLFADCVLDGQQRLSALEAWFKDGVQIECAAGVPRVWSDLDAPNRRRFLQRTFSRAEVSSKDEDLLREVYDLRAFGGVQHKEEERASLKVNVRRPRG